ncbi:MAG: hydroxymethylglutaryl-CoA synthase [Planctomycetes bacterium RBG_16_59_8]|nr:MAG: hydroxymethylglutaryl-CoA synthase [Planctomycetes bacterium RBG_16_59_8]
MVKAGIVGYGSDIPRYRIKSETIARQWGSDPETIKSGLRIEEKSVPAPDQDTITLSVEAARRAIKRAGISPRDINAIYVGSESHPYAVKPSGTVVKDAIGATTEVHCADFEFACKAGTEAFFVALNLVKAGAVKCALAIGADTSQGAPGDALEYSTAAGAAAFVMGKDNLVATVDETHAFMTDTPDFWRREYQHYPQHAGRFTGEPAYFRHVLSASREMMKKVGMKPQDFTYVVFHQPNGKFPIRAGKTLGFTPQQIEPGLLVPWLGNTYSGASPIGLTSTLDVAKSGDRILVVSYGSGTGSDAFVLTVTDRIDEVRDLAPRTRKLLDERKMYIDYGVYAKFRRKIRKAEK